MGDWARFARFIDMNWVDWSIIAVVGISAGMGALTGLVWQVGKIGVLFLSFMASAHLHGPIARALGATVKTPQIALILSYMITFVIAYAALLVVLWLVAFKALKAAKLKGIDRCLGAGLGAIKGALLSSILLLVLSCYPAGGVRTDLQNSRLAPAFLNVSRALAALIPGDLKHKWDEFTRTLPGRVTPPSRSSENREKKPR